MKKTVKLLVLMAIGVANIALVAMNNNNNNSFSNLNAINDGIVYCGGEPINTYQGKPITADSILRMVPELPDADKPVVDTFMNTYKDLIIKMTTVPVWGENEAIRERCNAFCDAINDPQGLKRLDNAPYNYLFGLKKPENNGNQFDFVVKIAGPGNRRENYNALFKKEYGSAVSEEQYNQSDTYQGISRVAHYLRFIEWVKNNKKEDSIAAPDTYLVHIPGQPENVCDSNYVVVQRWIQHMNKPNATRETSEIFLKNADDMQKAIQYSGYFNPNNDNLGITKDGKVWSFDQEQPNNSSPSIFCNRDPEKYVGLRDGDIPARIKEVKAACEQQLTKTETKS